MAGIENALYALGELDRLAARSGPLHDLDPRAKTWVTLAFVATVMSYGPHDLSGPLPLALYPVALAALGDVPAACVGRKLLLASPFVLGVGIFNPLLDAEPLLRVGSVSLSGGWVSFFSIALRFVLTVSAAILLVGVTGFNSLCAALPRMGVPRVFAVQLLFLYRYVFVLIHEGARMQRARDTRSFGRRGQGLSSYAPLLGQLLLRTMDRATRIHQAMLCRGFDGALPLRGHLSYTLRDIMFITGWLAFFSFARCVNVPHALGSGLASLFTGLPL